MVGYYTGYEVVFGKPPSVFYLYKKAQTVSSILW